ncbi:MAG: glycosyltransferase [Mucilaginibacter sp.]|uniref:glycosyltransferase n=1 Tax=Mucilaginibacter sp. TaxID=1882438 RepID=UPI0034E552B4
MKIALTADPELPVPPQLYGGIERIINGLITNYTQQGHDVTLFAHPDSTANCKLIPYPGKDHSAKSFIANCFTISKNILRGNFDIVHSFGRLAYLTPVLPLKIPKLMSYQREPTISQVKKALLLAKKNSLYFSGCSNYITNQIKPFAPAFTVYNGVSTEIYQAETTVKTDAPLVFLGRIEPVKGTHIAIEIALKTQKKLIIAGNIPAEHQYYFDQQIQPFLNTQITYIGAVNDEQKNNLLQNSLALLMPVQWNEPFGIVMIEAMACGTPVIGFKRGAVPEVITYGKTGFYGETVAELIEAVQQVHLLNRSAIRKLIENQFSDTIIAAQYLDLYQRISGKNSI